MHAHMHIGAQARSFNIRTHVLLRPRACMHTYIVHVADAATASALTAGVLLCRGAFQVRPRRLLRAALQLYLRAPAGGPRATGRSLTPRRPQGTLVPHPRGHWLPAFTDARGRSQSRPPANVGCRCRSRPGRRSVCFICRDAPRRRSSSPADAWRPDATPAPAPPTTFHGRCCGGF